MSLAAKARRAPLRAVTGAFILNAGIGKLGADEETAKHLHGMATGTYGFLGKLDPRLFAKGLGAAEVAVGGALVLPFVSPVVAGAALAGFSGALLNLYWQTPGMHEDGNPRPTQQGTAVAKDVWMFGIGTGLLADALLEPAHNKHVELATTAHERTRGKQKRKARAEARKARREAATHVLEMAKDQQQELNKRARKAAKQARKSAEQARKSDAAKRGRELAEQARQAAQAARDSDAVKHAKVHAQDFADHTVKQSRKAAKQARKLAKQARKSDAVKNARSYAKDAAEQARQAARDARDSDAAQRARELAVEASHRVADAAAVAAEKTQEVAAHAAERTKQAVG